MKSRLNCYFSPELADRLGELSARQGIHRSQLVEAAVASFLSPDALDRREAAFVRRLDQLSRQVERLQRHLTIATEAHALFVEHWLSVTMPLSDRARDAAHAQGAKRYRGFVETLGRRLQQGGAFMREVSEEIWPHEHAGPANGTATEQQEADRAVAF